MFRFLRNKLLATFMIIGAMTQVSQAEEKQVDKEQPVAQASQKKAGSWKSDEEFLHDFTETAIQSAYEIELPSLHGIAVEKVELQRTISFEFADRYQEAAEKTLRTGDKSYLKKIYKERDEILAQRQKAWDDGTFDKLAEAKRWAEYLKQRAIDQTLVNYPIEVGRPPFPIDMSILTAQDSGPAAVLEAVESDTNVPNKNITYKTSAEAVEELLHELDQKTTIPFASVHPNSEVDPEVAKVVSDTFASLSDDRTPAGVREYEDVMPEEQGTSAVNAQSAPEKPVANRRVADTGKETPLDPAVAKLSLDIFSALSEDSSNGSNSGSLAKDSGKSTSPVSSVLRKSDSVMPEVAKVSLDIFSDGQTAIGKEQIADIGLGKKPVQQDLVDLLEAIESEEGLKKSVATASSENGSKQSETNIVNVASVKAVTPAVAEPIVASNENTTPTTPASVKKDNKVGHQKDLDALLDAIEKEEMQKQTVVATLPTVEAIGTDNTSPAPDSVASLSVNDNHSIAGVDHELASLLDANASSKTHTSPHQKDLEDLLADLEREEKEHSVAATAHSGETANSEPMVAQADTVSLPPTNTVVNLAVAANETTSQTNSVMPNIQVAGKIFPTEKENNEFKEMLKRLDEEVAAKIPANLDPVAAPADKNVNPSVVEIEKTLQDLNTMLAENTPVQSVETPSAVSKDEKVDLSATLAAKPTLTDTAKIVEKEVGQGEKELNELIAYTDKPAAEEKTASDQNTTQETSSVVVKAEKSEQPPAQDVTTGTVQNPVQETVEKTVVAVAEKSERVSTPQGTKKRNGTVQADLAELLALTESEYPTPEKPNDNGSSNGSSTPWDKIALISLGSMLMVGALKRPVQDKWKSFRKWGYIPRSEIFGNSCGKLEQMEEAIMSDKATENTVADIIPVAADTQSKPAENNAPGNPIPANMQIRAIQHDEDLTQEERNFLAERLHAVRLMEDIKRERYKLTRQMAKAKANNDTEQIKTIESYRSALKALRKEAFETAAGPLLGQIKEERRLLTKKMTIARRRKDAAVMAEITKRRAFLKIQEEVLKTTVREFKYKQERATFLKPTLVQKMTPGVWKKRTTQHTRV